MYQSRSTTNPDRPTDPDRTGERHRPELMRATMRQDDGRLNKVNNVS